MCVCAHVSAHVCMCCMHMFICVRMCVCVCVCVYVRVCMFMCMYMYVHMCLYVCVCVYVMLQHRICSIAIDIYILLYSYILATLYQKVLREKTFINASSVDEMRENIRVCSVMFHKGNLLFNNVIILHQTFIVFIKL